MAGVVQQIHLRVDGQAHRAVYSSTDLHTTSVALPQRLSPVRTCINLRAVVEYRYPSGENPLVADPVQGACRTAHSDPQRRPSAAASPIAILRSTRPLSPTGTYPSASLQAVVEWSAATHHGSLLSSTDIDIVAQITGLLEDSEPVASHGQAPAPVAVRALLPRASCSLIHAPVVLVLEQLRLFVCRGSPVSRQISNI